VTITTSSGEQNLFTTARSVGELLAQAGIQYTPDDRVEPSPDSSIRPGIVISYRKALQVYLADAGAQPRSIMCAGETVCDLLESAGASLSPLDRVEPPPTTSLSPGLRVEITRVEALDITNRQEIPAPVVYQQDSSLRRGQVQDVRPGSPGLAEQTTRVYFRNGQETARIDMGTKTLVQPTQRVARIGTSHGFQPISRGNIDGRQGMMMVATAYDPGPGSCGASADGRTATGAIATKGVCAVDPRVIPLGTRLWVEGYGYAIACDTGGAIKGNRIDVCFDTRAEALRWGRRHVVVYVVE
jgi:uncharacterized protein YabE (DUF348 family)